MIRNNGQITPGENEKKSSRPRVVALITVALIVIVCAVILPNLLISLPSGQSSDSSQLSPALTRIQGTENTPLEQLNTELRGLGGTVYPEPRVLSDFELIDHNGSTFTNESLVGQWDIVFFGFTSCPDICPLTMSELKKFYEQLEIEGNENDKELLEKTRIILVSIDPFNDSSEKMKTYVERFNTSFYGVTGDFSPISVLARELFIAHDVPPMGKALEARMADKMEATVNTDGYDDTDHSDHMSRGREQISSVLEQATSYTVEHSGHISIINPEGNYHAVLRFPHRYRDLLKAYKLIVQADTIE